LMGVGAVAGLQAAVAAAPAIGGLMGLGLVAGLAAKISAGKPAVKAAFSGMTEDIKQDLESISGPMDRVLINFSRDLRSLSSENIRELADMFEDAAGMAGQLASTVRPLIQNMLPGIKNALAAAQPTVDVLQQEIPELGTAIGGFMSDISEGADNGARTIKIMMDMIQSSLGILGEAIRLGNKWMSIFPPGILLLSEVGDKHSGAADAATRHAAGTEELAAAEKLAAEQARTEADALGDVIEKLTALGRMTLSVRDANRGMHESVRTASEALKQNGRTLDITTQKGAANQAALDGIANASNRQVEAMLRSKASMSTVIPVIQRNAQSFISMATAMGMDIRAAQRLASVLFAIPNITRTVTIRTLRDAAVRGGRQGGGEQQHHAGGIPGGDGLSWINERGPELVKFPSGSRVFSAEESKRIAGSKSSGPTVIELRSGGSRLDDLLVEVIAKAVKVRGGDVQLVLGAA